LHSDLGFVKLGMLGPLAQLAEQLTLNQRLDVPLCPSRYDFVLSYQGRWHILYLAVPPGAGGC